MELEQRSQDLANAQELRAKQTAAVAEAELQASQQSSPVAKTRIAEDALEAKQELEHQAPATPRDL